LVQRVSYRIIGVIIIFFIIIIIIIILPLVV